MSDHNKLKVKKRKLLKPVSSASDLMLGSNAQPDFISVLHGEASWGL